MNCQECRDLFDDMLDRRIKEPLKRRMLNHLTNCAECSARLERRRMAHAALFRALNHFDGIEHLSGGFADRLVAECRRPLPWWQNVTMPKWALIAASLVVMAGFVFAATVVVEIIPPRHSVPLPLSQGESELPIQVSSPYKTAQDSNYLAVQDSNSVAVQDSNSVAVQD